MEVDAGAVVTGLVSAGWWGGGPSKLPGPAELYLFCNKRRTISISSARYNFHSPPKYPYILYFAQKLSVSFYLFIPINISFGRYFWTLFSLLQ